MLSNEEVVIGKVELLELSGGSFFVGHNDKYAILSPDEALMALAHFIIKKQAHGWLKSENQRIQEDEIRVKNLRGTIERDLRKQMYFKPKEENIL